MPSSDMRFGKAKKIMTVCTASLLLTAQAGWAQTDEEATTQEDADQWAVMDNRGESRNEQPADVGNEPEQLEDDMASETAAQDADTDEIARQQDESAQAIAAQAFQNVPIDQLQGSTVTNLQGEEVGEVEDVVVSQQGENAALVVSTGGFLGIGGKEVILEAEQVEVSGDQIVWQSNEGQEALEQLPEYTERNYVSVR
jgi:sporulation protein YlmC with PRC-barrel domain